MKISQYMEMNDNETGLIGTGDISYKYTADNGKHLLVIRWHLLDKEIEYTGKEAKRIYNRMISDSNKSTLNYVIRIACDSVGIIAPRIREKTRKQEVVWARNMVFWYVNKYFNYSLAESGMIFDKDHATVLHGINEFNKEDKYQKENRLMWKKIFIEKCSRRNLLTYNAKTH